MPVDKFHRNFTEPSKNPANPPPTVSAPRVAPGKTRASEPTILSHLFPDFLPPPAHLHLSTPPLYVPASRRDPIKLRDFPRNTSTHNDTNYTCHHGPVCRHPPPRSPAAPLDREKPQPPRRPRPSRESHGEKPAVFPHHYHVDAYASRTCHPGMKARLLLGPFPRCVCGDRARVI